MSNKPFNPLQESDKEQLNKPTMKSKKMYRIELTEIDSIFKDMVLDAAISNGGNYVSLKQMEESANYLCRKYPTTGSCHTVTLTNNVLTIDKEDKNIVTITEVKILELDKPQLSNQEAKDLLNQESPTLNRYANTGIANSENQELLN